MNEGTDENADENTPAIKGKLKRNELSVCGLDNTYFVTCSKIHGGFFQSSLVFIKIILL